MLLHSVRRRQKLLSGSIVSQTVGFPPAGLRSFESVLFFRKREVGQRGPSCVRKLAPEMQLDQGMRIREINIQRVTAAWAEKTTQLAQNPHFKSENMGLPFVSWAQQTACAADLSV